MKKLLLSLLIVSGGILWLIREANQLEKELTYTYSNIKNYHSSKRWILTERIKLKNKEKEMEKLIYDTKQSQLQ